MSEFVNIFHFIQFLLCIVFFIPGFIHDEFVSGQSTSIITSKTTETFVEIHIIISTVVKNLPSCPCPSPSLAQEDLAVDLLTTATFLGAPTESAAVVELLFTTPLQAAPAQGTASTVSSYFINRFEDEIVVDSNPLALYLGSDRSLSQASDISHRLYISLPPGTNGGKLIRRFKDLLPVSIGDSRRDTVFNGFVEGEDGYLNFNITTTDGTFVLGFTICPEEESEWSFVGQRIYMYDMTEESLSGGCLAGAAKILSYSEYAMRDISGLSHLSTEN
ncbi:hypothetical protein TWF106_006084 [Orbilia oligospora]|uniref:Uncharacterized protein n=1 Tax=Orbilia oligospora TaxID=2813651 RepID=A0A6G1MNJ9_ORBOL|nr:hypothetical protein TWF788_000975 [Orbilia oligospora]KAF3220664.1 hypothetical protein TWF679_008859 [Orbilia oligospora]KAF3221485.1 hypothetical protein TWF106_006084 [Orbilia oligospora]KAF3231318.1 hypothetical protein TWF191_006808 [Orbilia oligospora]KAF3265475.1 hypothetical protein TWF192_000124 [Orbilia oligospora]